MTTPICRIGGKSKIANQLIENFPDFNTYVEPFLGAGNVFLRIPEHMLVGKKIILNDLDTIIYTIFTGLQKRGKWINEHIKREPITKEEFKQLLDKKHKTVSDLIRINKSSFFGQMRSFSIRKSRAFATNFETIGEKLKDVTIYNNPFEEIIKQFDSPTTFFYLDPPYESINQTDYLNYVTPEQVLNSIKNIKGKFMLSYNDSPKIRKLFNKFNIYEIETRYTPTPQISSRNIVELVICSF